MQTHFSGFWDCIRSECRLPADRALGRVSFSRKFPSWFLLIRVLTSHKYSVYSVAWSPDGKKIASSSYDKSIKIWDSQSGDCQSTLTGHSEMSVFFSSVSSLFMLIRVLTSHKYRVWSVAWSPDGKQIASGSCDTTIKIWDSQSGECQSTLTGHR